MADNNEIENGLEVDWDSDETVVNSDSGGENTAFEEGYASTAARVRNARPHYVADFESDDEEFELEERLRIDPLGRVMLRREAHAGGLITSDDIADVYRAVMAQRVQRQQAAAVAAAVTASATINSTQGAAATTASADTSPSTPMEDTRTNEESNTKRKRDDEDSEYEGEDESATVGPQRRVKKMKKRSN